MFASLPIIISIIALGVSITTAWMTYFRKGTILMIRPSTIFFGADANNKSKVFLRTLLISTAKRGRIIESMYLVLDTPNAGQLTFNIWVYGGRDLARGSGLFVGDTGVEANHHFLITHTPADFTFEPGGYAIAVYVHLLGDRRKKLMFSQHLEISAQDVAGITEDDLGIYFDWFPESSRYVPHIDRPKGKSQKESDRRLPDFLFDELMGDD